MSEWKNIHIGEICSSISNSFDMNIEKVILINTSDIFDGKILNHTKVENRNLKGQFKKTFQKDDILYSEIRPANRHFAYVDIEDTRLYVASTKIMVLRPNKEIIDSQFLYAILSSKSIIAELQHLAETRSGTFPQITFVSELASITIKLPDMQTQKKVSTLLRIFDEKMNILKQINHNLWLYIILCVCDEDLGTFLFICIFIDYERLNHNLEEQAKAIYKKMFIDNILQNSPRGKLEDIAEITMGQSPSGSSFNEKEQGLIFFQGRAEFGQRFPKIHLYTTEPNRIAKANDILMSVRAPVGDINIAYKDCCIGRGLAAIRSKSSYQSFMLYTMFALKKRLDMFNAEGTVFGAINKEALNTLPVAIPIEEKIRTFEGIVSPMDNIILNNYTEICKLEKIRDTLLPKLMSGEIDVSAVEIGR